MTDFEELIHRLQLAGVEYLIVGGVAATIHGSARLTQDLDIAMPALPLQSPPDVQ